MPLNLDDLNDALNDLKTTVAKDGYTDGLEAEIAKDYGIAPPLLLRKFQEKFQKHPRDYEQTDLTPVMRERAVKLAREALKGFDGPAASKEFAGILFDFDGKEYACIGVTREGVKCVRVKDQTRRTITFPNVDQLSRFVRTKIKKL